MNEQLEENTISPRNFRLVLAQSAISTFASSIFTILLLWMAITLTDSPFITGLVSSLLVIPLIFNFAVGAAIDKFSRKRYLAIPASLMRVLSSAILITVLIQHNFGLEESALLASATISGFTKDIFAPVRLVWSKKFLKKMEYLKGMSVMNIASRSASLSGYLVAGMIISASLYFSTVSVTVLFLASLIPILFLPAERDNVSKEIGLLKNIKEGLEYIAKTKVVLEVIIIFMLSGFFMGMTDSTFTVEIKNFLNLNASYLSLIFLSSSAGGIIGSTISPKLKGMLSIKFTGLYLLSGMFFLLMGAFPLIYTFYIMMFLVGMISGTTSPMITSIILGNTPGDKMGRIQGAMDTFGFSFNSASGIIAGAVMGIILPRYVFWIISAGLMAIAVAGLKFKELQTTEL